MAANAGFSMGTRSGINVTEISAMNCSVVNACVRVISDPIGFLPLHIYEQMPGDRRIATEHPLYTLLHNAPNPWMTATTFRQLLQSHLLTFGNAYSEVTRRSGSGEVIRMVPIDPRTVTPKFDGSRKWFEIRQKNGSNVEKSDQQIWHMAGLGFDGVKGYSVIEMARESIGLAQAMEQYGASFFGNGGRVPYLLKHPNNFKTEADFDRFKAQWNAAYGNAAAWHAVPMLTGGLEYEQIGMNPEDAQLLSSREFQIQEIARWYKVSPHKLADLSRATFSNIEHLNIEFLTETLSYWLKLWEQSIWLSLLSDKDKKRYYAEFNSDAILRGDAKTTAEALSSQVQNGLLTPNEGRKLYNRAAVTGGDINVIQLNMQSLPGQEKLSSQDAKVTPNDPKAR